MSVYNIAIDLMLLGRDPERLPEFNREILLAFAKGTDGEKSYIIAKLRNALWMPKATDWSIEVAAILLIAVVLKYNDQDAYGTIEKWVRNPLPGHDELHKHIYMMFDLVKQL